jgi:hypothetical protein
MINDMVVLGIDFGSYLKYFGTLPSLDGCTKFAISCSFLYISNIPGRGAHVISELKLVDINC